jgi:hypothetical protein
MTKLSEKLSDVEKLIGASPKIERSLIGGAHQQASERAAPPVSVEEKGKATGKMLLFLLMSIQYQN